MPRVEDLQLIRLRDGRRLEFVETGDPAGRPFFLLHGVPGGCLGVPDVPASAGARVIVPNRPGYGSSDPQPGRRIADCAVDVADLADALGIGRFALIGFSMGGPHALACACLLPARVTVLGLVSAAGPNRRSLGAGTQPAAAVSVAANLQAAAAGDGRADDRASKAGKPGVSPGARSRIRRPHYAAVADNVLRQRGTGIAADLMARARPWGFSLADLRAPTFIYQGETDLVVPASAARQYERLIPHAIARYYPGEAHRALWAHVTEIVADLLGQS